MAKAPNLILIGFSATGKSRVGRRVAQLLGWTFVDTDDHIAEQAAKSIADIFAQNGEERFRAMESDALRKVCRRGGQVIATGGGAVLDAGNREIMRRSGVVVCLEAQPETIYERLQREGKEATSPVVRPLLAVPDPLGRIRSLKEQRQPLYAALADWTVHTDHLNEEQVASETLRGFEYTRPRSHALSPTGENEERVCWVHTSGGSYPVYVGWGILMGLGQRLRQHGLSGTAYVISDSNVLAAHGFIVQTTLEVEDFQVASYGVPAGEASKSLERAEALYHWLIQRKAERGHTIVALGGGMVGDLAGFVAATFLRGMPFVQVPTSLIAMADAAIGGKVAINHPQAKNIIGAFYQPRLVLMDPQVLQTLPQRELRSGWAEIIKHGIILDPGLLEMLEHDAERLLTLHPAATVKAIERSSAIKASIVSQDEREATGLRTILNYGHTIGHALEAATAYGAFLHGEAVSIGMMGAALISQRMGLLSGEVAQRHEAILKRYGLPIRFSGISTERLLEAMTLDKKVSGKAVRWVLLEKPGKTVIRADVPQQVVEEVLAELSQGDGTASPSAKPRSRQP